MTSGWDTYYVILVSALLSLAIPAALAGVSKFVAPRGRRAVEAPVSTSATRLGDRVNTRYFLGVNVSLALLGLGLLMIPIVAALAADRVPGLALFAILSISVVSGLGLLFASRKGDLDWQRSHVDGGSE